MTTRELITSSWNAAAVRADTVGHLTANAATAAGFLLEIGSGDVILARNLASRSMHVQGLFLMRVINILRDLEREELEAKPAGHESTSPKAAGGIGR